MKTINVGLVGITGYAGMELARLLANHPVFKLNMACSRAESGKRLAEYYPFLDHLPGQDVVISVFEPEESAKQCDIVFLAVPHGTAMNMAGPLLAAGAKVVDFSADFRLHDATVFKDWYNVEHSSPELLPTAIYGLPEIYGADIAKARLVANPGCYPTSAILGLHAALANDIIETNDIVIDSKSGTTGAGRKAAIPTLFCEVSDNFRAYGLPRHRHTPEIEQEISAVAKKPICLSFNTHLLPINRGILSTIYTKLKNPGMGIDDIHDLYEAHWANAPWVRVLPRGKLPETRYVRGSMFCDLGLVVDERTGRLIILSAIDNICRGASGQALANANLMCGLPVGMGLDGLVPLV